MYLDGRGRPLPDSEIPAQHLEGIPAQRWTTVAFKVHVPPAAAACRVLLVPDAAAPETLYVHAPVLRYARGNDLFLEFLHPGLKPVE